MTNESLVKIIIECLKENLELSKEPVPVITRNTKPGSDLDGFDSLRTMEVIVTLEEKLDCELPPEEIFKGRKFEEVSIEEIAIAIAEIIEAIKK